MSALLIKKINNNNYEVMYITLIPNKRNNTKAIYSTNLTINKGFLEVNTTHKGKFTHYDYASNIKIYKDLFKDIIIFL